MTTRIEVSPGESAAQLQAIVNLVPDLLWQSNPDGYRYWFNHRWYEYTAQAHDEAIGWGWAEAIHPDDREGSRLVYSQGMISQNAFRTEHRLRGADGSYRWFAMRAEPLIDPEGHVVRWIGSAADIHGQKMALEEVEYNVILRTRERDALRRQLASAEEEERRRVARNLHDQLGQHLTALQLNVTDLRRMLKQKKSVWKRLTQLEELSRVLTRDARYLALELRPPELDDAGLEGALASYVEQWSERFQVKAEVNITGAAAAVSIPSEIASALYRIAQEALTNVARHADATSVSVVLDKPPGAAHLIIEDDGIGFDLEAAERRLRSERRLGLAGIRERAVLMGAELEIETSPGNGTTIYVRVQLV